MMRHFSNILNTRIQVSAAIGRYKCHWYRIPIWRRPINCISLLGEQENVEASTKDEHKNPTRQLGCLYVCVWKETVFFGSGPGICDEEKGGVTFLKNTQSFIYNLQSNGPCFAFLFVFKVYFNFLELLFLFSKVIFHILNTWWE